MSLALENIDRIVGNEVHLNNINISLEAGSFNVLLGRTLSGKTSLMRLVAGLDKPTSGLIRMNGVDVTGIPVQERNVSMVYQQFINYPNMTVRENIASPLRLEKVAEPEIKRRVQETAALLHIELYLDRYPLELSGGQQQRTSMARALVKDASIILFDEPLVNLDYKLREALRTELRELFKERKTIAIYATTEPNEALALGGTTTLLHEGRVIQTGLASDVYRRPTSVEAAKIYSEPPINLIRGSLNGNEVTLDKTVHFPLSSNLCEVPAGEYLFGILPSHSSLVPKNDDDLELSMIVRLVEISGSETFMHVFNNHFEMVVQLSGVHVYHTDAPIKVYVPTQKLFVFDLDGKLIRAPSQSMAGQ